MFKAKLSKIYKLLIKIISTSVSCLFYLFIAMVVFAQVWQIFEITSIDDIEIKKALETDLKFSLLFVFMSLLSLWANKKLLMIAWMVAYFYLSGSFASLFPQYSSYLTHNNCLDDGGVWDESTQKCRHDCLRWSEKDGCVLL